MPSVTMTMDGKKAIGNVEPRTLLAQFMRKKSCLCRCGTYRQIIEAVIGCSKQMQGRFVG
jgi:aerobic-type carbon monoxide dehydrogenase small subunit (CoxS/CutS family)